MSRREGSRERACRYGRSKQVTLIKMGFWGGRGLLCAKGNVGFSLKRNSCPTLNYLEELALGALLIIRDYQR